jgi:NADH-quinone oxidoreductase subunit G/NADP-reducing hydrogenase subunit HndD
MVTIEVNNQQIQAKKGETILDALKRNGIKVPTLCHINGLIPTGHCRMCVVEVEGRPDLVPSCSSVIENSIKIKTHSPRVIKTRKLLVELLLSNHPDDCLYCIGNGNCELQNLAVDLNVRERRFAGNKLKGFLDQSSPGIVYDPSKCILCGRCVRICDEVMAVSTFEFVNRGNKSSIATSMNKGINASNCIQCGQCILYCPTAALYEKSNLDVLFELINNKQMKVVVQYSPSVAVAIADALGIKTTKDNSGLINAALRKMGFYKVFDTSFSTDLLIYEQTAELLDRIKFNTNLPLISSCCPAWIKYMEQAHADLTDYVSTCKSPQQMLGTLIKTYFAEKENIPAEKIVTVSVMPCPAKKFEAQREQMTEKGITDVDLVLTTRELIKLIKLYGIDIQQLEEEYTDAPFSARSSAAKLTAVSGGMAEGLMRTLYHQHTKKELPDLKISKLRNSKEYKELHFQVGDLDLGIAVVSGLRNAIKLLDEIRNGRNDIHYVEIMACPGGCVNGGGQPFSDDEKGLKNKIKNVYDIDEKDHLRVAHKNIDVLNLYENFLDEPLGVKANKLIHTSYSDRDVLL